MASFSVWDRIIQSLITCAAHSTGGDCLCVPPFYSKSELFFYTKHFTPTKFLGGSNDLKPKALKCVLDLVADVNYTVPWQVPHRLPRYQHSPTPKVQSPRAELSKSSSTLPPLQDGRYFCHMYSLNSVLIIDKTCRQNVPRKSASPESTVLYVFSLTR